jgi:hypothetical protein
MAISTIRRFTDEDAARVEATAKRFAARWSIKPNMEYDHDGNPVEEYVNAVESEVYQAEMNVYGNKPMVRAWRRCFARALGEQPSATLTVGYGYVGHRTE